MDMENHEYQLGFLRLSGRIDRKPVNYLLDDCIKTRVNRDPNRDSDFESEESEKIVKKYTKETTRRRKTKIRELTESS